MEASRADRCQFLAVGNAINFRFWDLSAGKEFVPSVGRVEGETFRGSMYMWRRLRLAVARGEFLLDAGWLAELTPQRLEEAFADDEGRFPLHPGVDDRVTNLRDLGSPTPSIVGG